MTIILPTKEKINNVRVKLALDFVWKGNRTIIGNSARRQIEELLKEKIECSDKHWSGSVPKHHDRFIDNGTCLTDAQRAMADDLIAKGTILNYGAYVSREDNEKPQIKEPDMPKISDCIHNGPSNNMDTLVSFVGHEVTGFLQDIGSTDSTTIVFKCGSGITFGENGSFWVTHKDEIDKAVRIEVSRLKDEIIAAKRLLSMSGMDPNLIDRLR